MMAVMRTELDRLEALYEEWYATESTDRAEVLELQLTQALPDLIRVARAADGFCHGRFIERDKQLIALNDVLAPLYREVKS